MFFSKFTSRKGAGHFSLSSGVVRRLAASSAKRNSLRRQHIFTMPAKAPPVLKPIFLIMNHDAHTLREFDAALSSLNTHLLQMAYKAQSALDLAAAGLLQQNESASNQAIADDEELDELEMTVDREGLHLLAFSVP